MIIQLYDYKHKKRMIKPTKTPKKEKIPKSLKLGNDSASVFIRIIENGKLKIDYYPLYEKEQELVLSPNEAIDFLTKKRFLYRNNLKFFIDGTVACLQAMRAIYHSAIYIESERENVK